MRAFCVTPILVCLFWGKELSGTELASNNLSCRHLFEEIDNLYKEIAVAEDQYYGVHDNENNAAARRDPSTAVVSLRTEYIGSESQSQYNEHRATIEEPVEAEHLLIKIELLQQRIEDLEASLSQCE
jgi:hypothetical protein